MKKAVKSSLLIFFIVLALIFTEASVFAQNKINAVINVTKNDNQVFVTLSVPAGCHIGTASAKIKFDNSLLKLNKVTYPNDENIVGQADYDNDNIVTAKLITAQEINNKADIFTLVFDIVGSQNGNVVFDVLSLSATDLNDKPLTVSLSGVNSGKISKLPDAAQNTPSDSNPPQTTEKNEAQSPDNIPKTSGKMIFGVSIGAVTVLAAVTITFIILKKKKQTD